MTVLNFAFCVNNDYARYVGVAIKSIVENHREFSLNIFVLTDYFSRNSEKWLNGVVKDERNVSLQIIKVNDFLVKGLKETWSKYAWYRILLPNVLPAEVERVLYLDADVIVCRNVSDLFELNMDDKSIAAVYDYETINEDTYRRCGYNGSKGYVCSGVLLMNLNYWRNKRLTDAIIVWGKENADKIKFPDQDTINYLCQDTKIILPLKYGILNGFFLNESFYKHPFGIQLKECVEAPAIIHYAGHRPWIIEQGRHIMQNIWEKYNRMLSCPVKRTFESRGIVLLKVMLNNLFHPKDYRSTLSLNDVLEKLDL